MPVPAIRTSFENFELASTVRTNFWTICPDENSQFWVFVIRALQVYSPIVSFSRSASNSAVPRGKKECVHLAEMSSDGSSRINVKWCCARSRGRLWTDGISPRRRKLPGQYLLEESAVFPTRRVPWDEGRGVVPV